MKQNDNEKLFLQFVRFNFYISKEIKPDVY